jgi:hypothetical protein
VDGARAIFAERTWIARAELAEAEVGIEAEAKLRDHVAIHPDGEANRLETAVFQAL